MATATRQKSSSRTRREAPDDPTTAYARDVVAGRIIAGPHVRDACRRHLRDLEEGPGRGLFWDVAAADRVIRYFRTVLKLNGGEHEGRPFELEPSQAFIVGSLFGWKRADGSRRFRIAFVEQGKGNGKSPLAAGIGHYMTGADGEPRAETYAAAVDREQASILFRDAVAMARQAPAIASRVTFSGGEGREYNIAYMASGSFFRPISSESSGRGKSGFRPHCILLDEIHEHPTNAMVEWLLAGFKGRRQPLAFMITNSGYDRTSVCWEYHEYGVKVARGDIADDSFFAYICALDPEDDPFEDAPDPELGFPACWLKANPLLGVTFQPSYLEEQVRQARGMPGKESIVRRLNFCQWVDAANPWIDGDLWRACEVDPAEWTEPDGPSFLGLDLSSTGDLTACARAWRVGEEVWAEVYFWTPQDTLTQREHTDRVPYTAWVRSGDLFATPGRSISYDHVAAFIAQLRGDVAALAFDQHKIEDFRRAMDRVGVEGWIWDPDRAPSGVGIRLVRHGQGFGRGTPQVNAQGEEEPRASLWMPASIKVLRDLILEGRLKVRRSPVLTWNVASAVTESDAAGNEKWEKRKSTGRIDGIVALSMAVGAMDKLPALREPQFFFVGV